jgi:hypothetical protein
MIQGQAALTVADLCSNNSIDSNHIDDDHSTTGFVDDDDDDSFLANSSLCKQHRSTIQMLDSLRKEVIEMARGDNNYVTPKKAPKDVTIDLNNRTELSSPLTSPSLLSRKIIYVSNTNITPFPVLSNHRITPQSDAGHSHHYISSDDSTFCSMDNSINNEMNILKEAVKDLERELKAENLNSVFEAIERIGKSDDPTINNLLESEDKDAIREGIRTELLKEEQSNKPSFLGHHLLDAIHFFRRSTEICSTNVKILIASIFLYLIRNYISSWQE